MLSASPTRKSGRSMSGTPPCLGRMQAPVIIARTPDAHVWVRKVAPTISYNLAALPSAWNHDIGAPFALTNENRVVPFRNLSAHVGSNSIQPFCPPPNAECMSRGLTTSDLSPRPRTAYHEIGAATNPMAAPRRLRPRADSSIRRQRAHVPHRE